MTRPLPPRSSDDSDPEPEPEPDPETEPPPTPTPRTEPPAEDEHDPEWSRKRYNTLLNRIESNTGGRNQENDQPPGIDAAHIFLHLSEDSFGRFDQAGLESALQRSLENGDVFRYPDIEGHHRYARRTKEGVMAVLLEEVNREHPRRELVGWLNRQLEDLKANSENKSKSGSDTKTETEAVRDGE